MKENKGLSDNELVVKYESGFIDLSKIIRKSMPENKIEKLSVDFVVDNSPELGDALKKVDAISCSSQSKDYEVMGLITAKKSIHTIRN